MKSLFEFESKSEKYVFIALAILVILAGSFTISTFFRGNNMEMDNKSNDYTTGMAVMSSDLSSDSSPEEMYEMFKCSCCGQSIAANCCGMAKQRKAYVNELMLGGLGPSEVIVEMVKKFGFDVLMDQSQEEEVKTYLQEQAPDNPPKIEIEPETKNLGTISQKEGEQSTFFTITNTGGNDLIIENMDTSCMCTSARIIYDGKTGPTFGMSMHGGNPEDYELLIPPGSLAKLEVIYDPMAHGKQKKAEQRIIREVTVVTNDPLNFQKKVRIELIQIP